MSWHEHQKKTEKANQVGVIDVTTLIQKKEIRVTQEQENGADAIKESGRYKQRKNPKQDPMDVDSVSGPGVNPGKPGIFELKNCVDPPPRD